MVYQRKSRAKRSMSMSKFRAAWVRTAFSMATIYEYNTAQIIQAARREALEKADGNELDIPEDLRDEEAIENRDKDQGTVYLTVTDSNGNRINLNLTIFTFAELLSLKSVIDLAFALAAPAVRYRDRKAEEGAAKGEYNYGRLYRQLPEHIVRKRTLLGYGEGIRVGSEDVLAGKFAPQHFPERASDSDPGLAKPEPNEVGSQDSGETTDLHEGVLEVGNEK